MSGGNKKVTHTQTNVCVTFLLPPGIKGLIKELKLKIKIYISVGENV